MDLSMFKEGDRVMLETVTLMEETEFITRIEKIESNVITVLSPICKGAILRIPTNSRVVIIVFTGDKVYKAKGGAIDNFKEGNFHLSKIEITTEVERFERRNYYRLSIMKPVRIMKTDSEDIVEGKTMDISGGGMQLKSEEKLYKGQKLLVEVEIDGEFLELDGEVVSIVPGINHHDEKYGIKFLELGDKVVDKIVSYIFSVQRDRIRNDKKVKD